MIEKFLTTEQVANILQVHPFTILKFIKQGRLPGIKLGRVYRIKESDVQEFLDRSATKSHGEPKALPASGAGEQNASVASNRPTKEAKGSPDSDLTKDPNPYQIDNKDDNQQHYYII